MTQRAVSVSKNICSFMWDQKLFEVLLALGEGGFVGLFFFSFVSCFAKEKKHSCRSAVAWSPLSSKTHLPSWSWGIHAVEVAESYFFLSL